MSINYDADGKPEIDGAALALARSIGYHVINVICDLPKANVGDVGGVSFSCMVAFVPRKGERIELDDGTICEVSDVLYKTSSFEGQHLLAVNVYAIIVAKRR
jgi:hypothetical protein